MGADVGPGDGGLGGAEFDRANLAGGAGVGADDLASVEVPVGYGVIPGAGEEGFFAVVEFEDGDSFVV